MENKDVIDEVSILNKLVKDLLAAEARMDSTSNAKKIAKELFEIGKQIRIVNDLVTDEALIPILQKINATYLNDTLNFAERYAHYL